MLVLVANKTDLERKVSAEQGQALAEQLNAEYVETSALNGVGVKQAFQQAAGVIVERVEAGLIDIESGDCGVKQGGLLKTGKGNFINDEPKAKCC